MRVQIEIAKKLRNIKNEAIEEAIWNLIQQKKLHKNSVVRIPSVKIPELNEFQDQICCVSSNQIPENVAKENVCFIYYSFIDQGPETEEIESHESEQVAASIHWMLPNGDSGFQGLWESLVYDDNIKENLLDFARTMLYFSQKDIDQNIVSCNRLILLHGLPGTGKEIPLATLSIVSQNY